VGTEPSTDTVSVLPALPLGGGVTTPGLYAHVTPAGRLAQDRVTGLEKPPLEVTVQVLVPLLPCWMVRLAGLHDRLKSGLALGVPVAQLLAGP
jgi:hypothetical protein